MAAIIIMPLLVAAAALLGASPAATAMSDTQESRLFNMVPRPRLHEVTLNDLESALDLLTDLLEERRLPSGEKSLVSRLGAPTLDSDSVLCRRHTQIFWELFTSGAEALWPVLMFDASGKLPDGMLVGNLNAFGSMDECFLVNVKLDNSTYPDLAEHELHFTGRYVPVTVSPVPAAAGGDTATGPVRQRRQDEGLGAVILAPSLGLPTGTVGLCVPSSCSSGDVQLGLQTLLGDNVTVTAYTSQVAGQTADFRAGDIVVITIMALVGFLMLVGTALDVRHRRLVDRQAEELKITSVADSPNPRLAEMLYVDEPKPTKMQQRIPLEPATWQRVLIAFSVYTNTMKLLDTRVSHGTLSCIHGIRFFSMTWVVIGHATSLILAYDQNVLVMFDWLRTPWFQAVDNATLSVDTFYLLSGVVLSYSFCNSYKKKGKFNVIVFYIHRYLRLTPALAITIAFTATIFVYFGDGPLWAQTVELQQDVCQSYWWRNLLYIQNFFGFEDMCLAQSWYLATDMQMFLFSPLVLLPLLWKPLFGMIWLGVLTAGFLILRITIWSTKNLPPTLLNINAQDPEASAEMLDQYIYPWMRCTVWLTGVGLGYLLHRLRGRKMTINTDYCLSAWVVAFAIGISVIYGMIGYQMPWQEYSKAVSVTYGGLNRTAWGVAVAWLIFACVTGHGGPINRFLSYPGFIPLSRLTYAGYLIHFNVLLGVEGSMKGTMYVDAYRLTYRLLAHIIVTFASAMVLSLAFEAPFINLEKMMFEPSKPTAKLVSVPIPSTEAMPRHEEEGDKTSKSDQVAEPSTNEHEEQTQHNPGEGKSSGEC